MESQSIVHLLYYLQRETDHERSLRVHCSITRSIVLHPSLEFLPVWKRKSKKHVCIGLDRRMYFDNHQLCYFNDGIHGNPHLVYNFGQIRTPMKIQAVLLYHGHIRRSPHTPEEGEVCLLVLSADGYLRLFNADNGLTLRSLYLSTAIKYMYLQWADYLQTVQVKSVHSTKPPPRRSTQGQSSSRQATHPTNISSRLLVIAVFKIHPLDLVTCLSIDRHILGQDILDASVNQDILVISHSKGIYRMYSLTWIIEHYSVVKATVGQRVELEGMRAGVVGDPEFGIPLTIQMTECPPLLFESKSGSDLGVSFGGSPTVYIHNATPTDISVFHIHSLHSGELVTTLSTDTIAFHQDVAEFHHDDYQRVLHISGTTLSCYRLVGGAEGCGQKMVRLYSTDFRSQHQRRDVPLKTSSGRTIKHRVSTRDFDDLYVSAIQDVDYENELDLLYAVVTLPKSEGTSSNDTQAWLYFVDDKSGGVLKKVALPTWKMDASNSIYYELDCILHLVQENGSSVCHYYRLCRTAVSN